MIFVVDASAALSWVLKSQASAASDAMLASRRPLDQMVAPDIFNWEVGNVLLSLRRNRRLSDQTLAESRASLAAIKIESRPPLSPGAIVELSHLAGTVGLSLFDVAYLALAQGLEGTLLSRDERLLSVATMARVECLDLR